MSEANGARDRPVLPEGWEWKSLGEIVQTSSGGTPSRKRPEFYENGTVPWLKIGDLNDGVVAVADEHITADGLAGSSAKELPAGTLVVAMYGASIGKLGVLGLRAATNQAICALQTEDEILREYLFWFLRGQREALLAAGFGGAQANISQTLLKHLPVPLPPTEEQRRMVRKISELWAAIERGEDLLADVDSHFADFDASLLEAVCLGQLLHSPANGDESRLPALPSGSEWVAVADLAADEPRAMTDGPFGSNLKSSHYTEDGPRVIRLQNIGEGVFWNAEAHISHEHFETLRAHEAVAGDVVLAALGKALPRACVVPESLGPAIVKADCQRIRLRPEMNPYFAAACLNSRFVRGQAKSRVHGVGRPRLRLADAKQLMLPFPAREEQDAVVGRLNSIQTRTVALRAVRDEALRRADGLKRSLLRKAMSGSLG